MAGAERRNLVRLARDRDGERYRHSYFGEQLLSSSLFRLYRSLGGDTLGPFDSDLHTRLSASDYCVYLIMRAISLLGPDSLAPARTVDQFVAALIDADLGTGDWRIDAAEWPFDLNNLAQPNVVRHGGRVHKVIRWAFEQQGLYATDDPMAVADGLGRPPKVDVYLADGRTEVGATSAGGYQPVPLRWSESADLPWHADAGVVGQDKGKLRVVVANRGTSKASDVRVRAWYRGSSGEWSSAKSGVAPRVPAGGSVPVLIDVPRGWSAQGWIFVAVDSAADPSNLAQSETPPKNKNDLIELVAHDNNLALARLP